MTDASNQAGSTAGSRLLPGSGQRTLGSRGLLLLLAAVITMVVLGAVGVGLASGASADASLDVSGPTTATDNVTITYAVTNDNGTDGNFTVYTQTPDDWTITANESNDGTWGSASNVSFTNVADGETVEATITYETTDPTQSVYLFNATVADDDANALVDNATHPVVVPGNAAWDRAGLPLRADTSAGATVVENQRVFVNVNGTEGSANRDELAVFPTGNVPISLSNVDGADVSQYSGDDVHVLVGHVDENPDTSAASDASTSLIPTSVADAQNLLTAENVSYVNGNVTFSRPASAPATLDSNGELSFDLDASTAGQYGIIVVRGERLFEVNNGNVTAAGPSNGTVIGAEGVAVQSGASSVTAPGSIEPGENASFDVQTGLAGNVSHSVVVYHESTFTGTRTNVNVSEDLSLGLTTDDVVIEHEITELNGIVELDAGVSMFGMTVSEQRESGAILVEDIVVQAANEAGVSQVQTDAIGNVSLDGSAFGVADVSADGTIVVPTYANWTEGEYRYVHVASENDSTRAFETNTGTFTVEAATGGGGGGGGGGIFLPPPGDDGGDDADLSFENVQLSNTQIEPGGELQVTVTVRNNGDNTVSQALTLYANDIVLDQQSVTVSAGGTQEVTFTGTLGAPGTYDLILGNSTLGTVEVGGSQPPGQASIGVSSASLSTNEIEPGDSVTITANVENLGDAAGETTIDLAVDGETVDERTVQLDAGESTQIEFTRTFDEEGSYEIRVGSVLAGELTVEAEEEPPAEEDGDGSDGGLPILLIVVFLIGAIIAGVVGYLYHIGELETVIEDVQSRFE